MRALAAGVALLALVVAPVAAVMGSGLGGVEVFGRSLTGLVSAVDSVGWVLVPQLLLAVAIFGLALELIVRSAAGMSRPNSPAWLEPAVESALLLGLLGTISGMVNGFVGLSPEELQPGPLVHALGAALRSSFVGFLIALVGVWTKAEPTEATMIGRELRPA